MRRVRLRNHRERRAPYLPDVSDHQLEPDVQESDDSQRPGHALVALGVRIRLAAARFS
jgi:hypothetical protein